MKIGYARVSTEDQSFSFQKDALNDAKCEKIFTDKVSGVKWKRVGLEKMLDTLRKGDTVVVWRLDRLGRSMKELIDLVNRFQDMGVGFVSLTENIDTTTNTGRLVFHIFCALSDFERNLIRERTNAGLKSARARGRVGGRPAKMDGKKIEKLKKLYNSREVEIKDLMKMFGISRPTLYRYVAS